MPDTVPTDLYGQKDKDRYNHTQSGISKLPATETLELLFCRAHGIHESSSKRGTSSHQQNPSVILCDKICGEDYGECIGTALMYSGGFSAKIELDQLNQTRLIMVIDNENFTWTLNANEKFYTPEVIMSYSCEGLSKNLALMQFLYIRARLALYDID